MTNTSAILWPEFWLRTLTLHWITASALVLVVALALVSFRRLNATTRHTLWLLTLVSCVLMPLLVFAPRPSAELPFFALNPVSAQTSEWAEGRSRGAPAGAAASSRPALDVRPLTGPGGKDAALVPPVGSGHLTRASVVKGLFVFWLVGAGYWLRRLWGDYRAAKELEVLSDPVTPWFEQRFERLCHRLGIARPPALRFHPGIHAPMTVGVRRAWIAVPMTWRETLDAGVVDQTLTHELGHIARRDPMIYALQRLLCALLWMYPAVWYVSRQLDIERESACDDWVLNHDGKRGSYANNLLEVAETVYLQPDVLAVGCLRSHSQLSRRIQNLLNTSSNHRLSTAWAPLILMTVGFATTLGVTAKVWPDARQLAPAAQLQAPAPLPDRPALDAPNPPVAPVRPVAVPKPDAAPRPVSAPAPRPAPAPASPPAVPTVDGNQVIALRNADGTGASVQVRADNVNRDDTQRVDQNTHLNGNRDQSHSVTADGKDVLAQGFRIDRWPVRTQRISQRYGALSKRSGDRSKRHTGLDFPAREGSDVFAVASGYVEDTGFSEGHGNYVVIDHGNGYKTKYANTLENLVSKGQAVAIDQRIARVGNSGRDSTGPHLHFEVRLGGAAIDPESVYAPAAPQ